MLINIFIEKIFKVTCWYVNDNIIFQSELLMKYITCKYIFKQLYEQLLLVNILFIFQRFFI